MSPRALSYLAAAVAASAFVLPTSAFADQVRARYAVTLLGIPLGAASLDGDVGAGGYKIAVNAKLAGLAAMVSSSRGAATAAGAYLRGAIVPSAYANTSSNAKETRTVRMSMQGGAVKGVDVSPPVDPVPDRVPLTNAHTRNIVDPLSALIMPVPGADAVVGPAACNRTLPVYDGFTRFDVTLTYAGTRPVRAKGYSGQAVVCNARYTPIAGHRNRKPVQFMADNKDIQVWLAPVGDTRVVVPFRISVATMIGTTVIEATEFGSDGSRTPEL
ncbi:MAG: hypothetical protein JWN07_3377 [Hyphomicrobiales bacterium]|nr:hypothetical protein [Hyphomicrobiales bacterium]